MEKKSVVYGPQPRTAAFGLVLGYSRPPFQGLALCGSRCNRKFEVLSSTHCFVSIPEIVNPEKKARQRIDSMLVASGWVIKEQVPSLIIPLASRAEQTRIVAEVARRLSVVEELGSVVTAILQRAVHLLQSILQKAFTGELS
jgi:hypothetical protein